MSRKKVKTAAARRGRWLPLALYAVPLAIAATGGLREAGKSLAIGGASVAASPSTASAGNVSSLFGDARFRGQLDLAARVLEGDRFVVPLGNGQKAALTLDPDLQARAEKLLVQAAAPYGAIVVTSIDGRVLALAGRSLAEPELPVESLTLQPWAPSASIFKLVTAAALVEAGIEPETRACYHGGLRAVNRDDLVDSDRDQLCGDLAYGVAHSQNVILAKLASRHLDGAKLVAAAEALGYNWTPPWALPTLPPRLALPEEKLELARAAAGFWHTELSPLGGAVLAGTIARKGLRVTPRLVDAVIGPDGELPVPPLPPERVMDPDTAEMVGEMMVGTTEDGTARKAFRDRHGKRYLGQVRVAGKTGSLSRTEPSYLNYSWFVGYAPAEAPEYVVSVLLGNSATWRLKSHTVARLLLASALDE